MTTTKRLLSLFRRQQFLNNFNSMLEATGSSQTILDIKALLAAMEERQYNVTCVKWSVGITAGLLLFLSGKQIKNWLSSKTTEVTKQSMDNPEFRKKVKETATDVLSQMLEDKDLQNTIQTNLTQTLKASITDLYKDPEFLTQTESMVEEVVTSERVTQTTKKAMTEMLQDTGMQQELGSSLYRSVMFGFTPEWMYPTPMEVVTRHRENETS